jgi:hypothetical protein
MQSSRSHMQSSRSHMQSSRSHVQLSRTHSYPASALARASTSSSIASVSFPVNVFCWLG